jgi:hypothetical protein
MKHFISIIAMCCFLFGAVPLLAQTEPAQEKDQIDLQVKLIKTEVLAPAVLAPQFRTLLKADEEVKAIDTHLKKMGFAPQMEPLGLKKVPNFWGSRETYQNKLAEKGTYTVQLQSYIKQGSKDSAALGRVVLTVGERSEIYSFYLIAPGGNFEAMEEYRIDKRLNILKANSWWSCVKSYIKKKCASACLSALVECAPGASSVLGYVVCVAAKCGGCALKSMACCACDCSWWCKWAVGCCDR